MKQLFFTAAAIAIPGAIFTWIVWLFVKGVYTVISDWRLERELKQIRAESVNRPPREENAGATGKVKEPTDIASTVPVVSFQIDDDERGLKASVSPATETPAPGTSNPPNAEPPPAEPPPAEPTVSGAISSDTDQNSDSSTGNRHNESVTETSTLDISGNPPPPAQ
ncbi:MAG: hypothetical protein KDB27_02070 [Planctomycetales bacterium]|nr:hypothetical protein [Planctomycetales bacterium]